MDQSEIAFFDEIEQRQSPEESVLPVAPSPGDIAVWSRVHISNGVELHINPERAGLSSDQTREVILQVNGYVQAVEEE